MIRWITVSTDYLDSNANLVYANYLKRLSQMSDFGRQGLLASAVTAFSGNQAAGKRDGKSPSFVGSAGGLTGGDYPAQNDVAIFSPAARELINSGGDNQRPACSCCKG